MFSLGSLRGGGGFHEVTEVLSVHLAYRKQSFSPRYFYLHGYAIGWAYFTTPARGVFVDTAAICAHCRQECAKGYANKACAMDDTRQ